MHTGSDDIAPPPSTTETPTGPARAPRSQRRRKRRASVRVYLGTADRARLDRWATARGIGPASIARALVVDGLDRIEPATPSASEWRTLLDQPTGTHDRRRYAPHLSLDVLLRLVGPVRVCALLVSYGGSRLPSARTLGLRLRRAALLRHWQSERWHSTTFLRRLGSLYGMTPGQVRRVLGSRYLSKRTATYWRKRGDLAEREAAAGVIRKPTARLSIRVLR